MLARRAAMGLARAAMTSAAPTAARSVSTSATALGGGHDDHGEHGPYDPPMHRLPVTSRPLHEEDELMWNDGVAPEPAIDFDAPHVSRGAGLAWWLGGFAFFATVYLFAASTSHPSKKPSGDRELPESTLRLARDGEFGKKGAALA